MPHVSVQQEEIPAAPAELVQHDLHKVRCACGQAACRGPPAGRAGLRPVHRPQAAGPGRLPGGLPAHPGGAVPAADRRRDRRRRLRRLHPFLPGEGGIPGRGGGGADPRPDHRRARGLVRRDHAAIRRPGIEYVHGACTEEYSAFWLGARSLDSMADAGILPDFAGIVVSDRYQNYFHPRWKHIAGNQACLAHILRDYQDCAESYPGAVWPVQAQRALRGMIKAWHASREKSLTAIPADVLETLAHEFRHAVLAAGQRAPRPRPEEQHEAETRPRAARILLRPPRRRAPVHHRYQHLANEQHQRARRPPPQDPAKYQAAWPATTSPRTGSTSAATSTPPASTARTPWTSCTTSCSAGPGDRPHPRSPHNHHPETVLPITRRERAECLLSTVS